MPNTYIFHGIEEFLRAQALRELLASLGDESIVGMNTSPLDGQKTTLPEVITAASAMPFMGEKRLVVATGLLGRLEGKSGRPSKADQQFAEGLVAFLPNVSPTTVLVFDEDHLLPETHPVMQFAHKHPKAIEVRAFGRMNEVELRKWLTLRAKAKGGTLSPEAVDLLATSGDVDLRLLDQEIEKLLTYANGRPVSGGDVQKLVHAARSVDVFAMVDALGQRNGRRAIEQFHALVAEGEPPFRLLFMITRQFRLIMQAKDLSERRAPITDMMRSLGSQRFVVEKVLTQSRQFSLAQLDHIYRRLLETDLSIKTGQSDPLLAVDALIAEIVARTGQTA
jgi:DNA polymerase III subunit delta